MVYEKAKWYGAWLGGAKPRCLKPREYTERNGGFKDEVDEKCVCIKLERASTYKISALSCLLACEK